MALAISLPEVLMMQSPMCPRHRVPMIEFDRYQGCFRCPVWECDQTADLPPREDAGQPPADAGGPAQPSGVYKCRSVDLRGEAHRTPDAHWLSHIGIKWPLMPVRQSNARDDFSSLQGPPAPGRGGSKSGRRRKKPKKRSRGLMEPWSSEGGTNGKGGGKKWK